VATDDAAGVASCPVCGSAAVASRLEASYVGLDERSAIERAGTDGHAVRIVHPGEMVTMEYRSDRLTVQVDDAGRVLVARHG
jgi:hypothetical protein